MATMDASQVTIGAAKVTGAIYIAPKNTTLPTDATTALASAFKLLGFTSDAGVQIAENRESDSITAWEGRTKIIELVTSYTESVSFMPIQCNSEVAKLTWGDGAVTVDGVSGAITAKHHGGILDPVVIVIETAPRTGIVKRYCLTGQLTERGEQTMDGTQVDGRQLTFESVADSNGYTMFEYTAFVTGTTN